MILKSRKSKQSTTIPGLCCMSHTARGRFVDIPYLNMIYWSEYLIACNLIACRRRIRPWDLYNIYISFLWVGCVCVCVWARGGKWGWGCSGIPVVDVWYSRWQIYFEGILVYLQFSFQWHIYIRFDLDNGLLLNRPHYITWSGVDIYEFEFCQ